MHKDFDGWNEAKKKTDGERARFYTMREIKWCRLGVNIGAEQYGRGKEFLRPVVVLRGFGADACLVVPLTTSQRDHPLRIPVGIVDGKEAWANISQLRIVDTRRFVEEVGFLEKEAFERIRKAVRNLF